MSVVERRDHRALGDWFAESAQVWVPPRPKIRGRRRILAMFRAIFARYAELHWRVTEVYSLGPRCGIYLTDSWGTLDGKTPYHNHVMTLFELDPDGRILSLSDYFKDTVAFSAGAAACGCAGRAEADLTGADG
jgi:limonene-1,2-epoxide hydrolase